MIFSSYFMFESFSLRASFDSFLGMTFAGFLHLYIQFWISVFGCHILSTSPPHSMKVAVSILISFVSLSLLSYICIYICRCVMIYNFFSTWSQSYFLLIISPANTHSVYSGPFNFGHCSCIHDTHRHSV